MVSHRKGFFGSKTGILFDSGPPSSPDIFLTFIKKKMDGSWEKPSKKEGRTIKLSLVDIAFVLQVLRGEKSAWKTVHSFEERKISISFERVPDDIENLKVKAGNYLKLLNYGEIEVFKALPEHAFQEKVITSTSTSISPSTEGKKREEFTEPLKKEKKQIITEEPLEEKMESVITEAAILAGVCKGETEKALLIEFEGKKEIWVPKSTIHTNFDSKSTETQKFEIDTWILKKNNLL